LGGIAGGTTALGKRNELRSVHDEAAGIGEDALVLMIEQIEGFDHEGEAGVVGDAEIAAEAAVGGAVGWSDQCVAAEARQAVVETVAVLVGVACDFVVVGAPAADGYDAGELPVVEEIAE